MLDVITEESLKRVAALHPRWVCSKGVVQHVPPEELDEFFGNHLILIKAGATGLLFSPRRAKKQKGLAEDLGARLRGVAAHGMQLDKTAGRVNMIMLRVSD